MPTTERQAPPRASTAISSSGVLALRVPALALAAAVLRALSSA
jgi:hypothetical protein